MDIQLGFSLEYNLPRRHLLFSKLFKVRPLFYVFTLGGSTSSEHNYEYNTNNARFTHKSIFCHYNVLATLALNFPIDYNHPFFILPWSKPSSPPPTPPPLSGGEPCDWQTTDHVTERWALAPVTNLAIRGHLDDNQETIIITYSYFPDTLYTFIP